MLEASHDRLIGFGRTAKFSDFHVQPCPNVAYRLDLLVFLLRHVPL